MKESEAFRRFARWRPDTAAKVLAARGEAASDSGPMTVLIGGWPSRIDGSERRLCGTCGVEGSISPSTIAMLRERTGPTLFACWRCAVAAS